MVTHSASFKIVLLGAASVGKSAIVRRLTRDIFLEQAEATVGAAFMTHVISIDSATTIRVDIWDTAGQERYASLAPMYYRGATAAFVVFDQTVAESYQKALYWIREVRNNVSSLPPIIALLANKNDLVGKKEVDIATVAAHTESNGVFFFETSAKSGENVQQAFQVVGREIIKRSRTMSLHEASPSVGLKLDGRDNKSIMKNKDMFNKNDEEQYSFHCCL